MYSLKNNKKSILTLSHAYRQAICWLTAHPDGPGDSESIFTTWNIN